MVEIQLGVNTVGGGAHPHIKRIGEPVRIREFFILNLDCKPFSLPKQPLTALAELRYGRQNLA